MNNKCPACDGKRTVTKQFRDYICVDCLGSGRDLTRNKPLIAAEQSNYAVSTAVSKMEIPKRGRPKKNAR
jgi:hypothetical protein